MRRVEGGRARPTARRRMWRISKCVCVCVSHSVGARLCSTTTQERRTVAYVGRIEKPLLFTCMCHNKQFRRKREQERSECVAGVCSVNTFICFRSAYIPARKRGGTEKAKVKREGKNMFSRASVVLLL